jgi:transketolase N-terminal domain/subunit
LHLEMILGDFYAQFGSNWQAMLIRAAAKLLNVITFG